MPGSVCAEHSKLTLLGGSRKTGRGVNETVMKQLPPYLLAAYKERNRKSVNCTLSKQSALHKTSLLTRGKRNTKYAVPIHLGASWLHGWQSSSLGAETTHVEGLIVIIVGGLIVIITIVTMMVMLTTANDAEVSAQSSLCSSLHKR